MSDVLGARVDRMRVENDLVQRVSRLESILAVCSGYMTHKPYCPRAAAAPVCECGMSQAYGAAAAAIRAGGVSGVGDADRD